MPHRCRVVTVRTVVHTPQNSAPSTLDLFVDGR